MRLRRLLASGALLLVSPSFAASGYVFDVQTPYTAQPAVKRIAVVPVVCPAELDCDDLEKTLAKRLAKRTKLEVLPADETRAVMQRAGIGKLDFESRFILAEGMKVDGFATLEIQQASVEEIDGGVRRVGVMQVRDKIAVKHVKLIVAVETKDGTTLLAARGEANAQTMSSLDGVAERTLEEAIDEAVEKD